MVNNKTIKLLTSIIMILIMSITLTATTVFAANGTLSAQLSRTRWVKNNSGTYVEKGAYALNTGSDKSIFQIIKIENGEKKGTNYYCLNAEVGASWRTSVIGDPTDYDRVYDLVNDKSEIAGLSINAYKNIVNDTNYGKLMWLFDNMYVEGGTSIQTLLQNAGILYGNTGAIDADVGEIEAYYYDIDGKATGTSNNLFLNKNSLRNADMAQNVILRGDKTTGRGYWYIDSSNTKKDVILSDYPELVEAIQQAVIWYFTNGGTTYDAYTQSGYTNGENELSIKYWLKYANNGTDTLHDLADQTTTGRDGTVYTGAMLQEQACILYNYLVDGAEAHSNYTSTSTGTLDIAYTGNASDSKVTESGDNYIVGPLKITTTGTVTGLELTTTPAGGTVTDGNGTAKTLKENEDFYVKIAKSSVTNSIKIAATATSTATKKDLWIKEVATEAQAEQPLLEVKRTPTPLNDDITIPLEKQFDLALRKRIIKIEDSEGNTLAILNEDGRDATRSLTNIVTTSIPDTATYNHRKDPVVVKTEDVVTYRITIYNEGEIDGYASKIVDQLPAGMQSVLANGATITSNKGTTYTITAYDTTTNKIELTATASTAKTINKYDGTALSSDYIEIKAKVNQQAAADGATKRYLTNIAYIAEGYDTENSKVVTEDRNGNESKTTQSPNETANDLNSTDANSYKGDSSNQDVKTTGTNNDYYFKGEQDDDDFEKVVVMPKKFDLALRKFITKINSKDITTRVPVIGDWKYDPNNTTLEKSHPKDKLAVAKGDTVVYTIRVYNEGEVDGFASKVTDYLPAGLTLKAYTAGDESINDVNGWTANGQEITTTKLATEKINAFNKQTNALDYKDLQVECIVNDNATSSNLMNIAEITEAKDENGNTVTDIDSTPDNVNKDNYNPTNPDNGRGEQDDDDFEDLKLAEYDLALRKFIAKVNDSLDFDTVSEILPSRAPQVDTTELKAGTANTAIYNHEKEPMQLNVGDYVLYTIRVYNEGDLDAYASQIIDYLPEYLDFVTGTEADTINSIWDYDNTTRKVTTKATAANATTLLKAFDSENDNGAGSGLFYVDVQIICRINKNAEANKKLTNIAEISEYKNAEGTVVNEDRDSQPKNLDYPTNPETYKDTEIASGDKYIPGQQDDDDFEKVIVIKRNIDLALTKFITAVSSDTEIEDGEYLTPNKKIGSKSNEYIRATVADTTGLKAGTSTNATYTAKKDIEPLTVFKNSYILYNIRVYNEGEEDVYAGEITDYLPENLEFVDGEFNEQYGWTANGQTVKTTYLSSSNGTDKILKAFDKENDDGKGSGLDYKDLPILCKVSDKAESGKKLVNTAEITKYEDKDGNEIEKDIDSTPENKDEKNVENRDEDDDDYEVVEVKEFDLSLLKYVTKTIVTENGKTTTTKTGNTGAKTDITPKVEIYRKSVNKTIVKFEFTIKITNEGDIAGYAKEITDYVPKGLKFYASDNKGWKDEGNNVISTTLLKNTLLQPGQSATVKVILRWINGENNLGLKTNVAEISKDYNEEGVPDRDSTPDNKKSGEDDIDDAPVLLTISTGMLENPVAIASGALAILVVLGLGIVAIKKYVL